VLGLYALSPDCLLGLYALIVERKACQGMSGNNEMITIDVPSLLIVCQSIPFLLPKIKPCS